MGIHDKRRREFRSPGEVPWQKTLATADVVAGQLLRVLATTPGGAYYSVVPAISDGSQKGTLLVAVADAPAGTYSWARKTALVDLDTSSATLGDRVYVSSTVAGQASLVFSSEPVGWVTEVATAGKALLEPTVSPTPLGGSVNVVETAVSATTTAMGLADVYAATAADVTMTVQTSDVNEQREFVFKDHSGAASAGSPITIDTQGAETIDDADSITIVAPYGSVNLYVFGGNLFSK